MRKTLFFGFRTIARIFHNKGLRRIKIIEKVYLSLLARLRPSSTLFAGNKMYLPKDDCLGLSLFDDFEPAETKAVLKFVKKGDNAIDMGAHIGYYSLLFAKLVGSQGRVFSFEPSPENFSLLSKNIKANNYKNITAVNAAVSDKTGTGKLYICNTRSGDHRTHAVSGRKAIDINFVGIDDFLKNHKGKIDFIKMDIQGAEANAFKGMKKLLQENPEIKILIEFWPKGLKGHGADARKFLESLLEMGFVMYTVNRKRFSLDKISIDKAFEEAKKLAPNLLLTKDKKLPDVIRL